MKMKITYSDNSCFSSSSVKDGLRFAINKVEHGWMPSEGGFSDWPWTCNMIKYYQASISNITKKAWVNITKHAAVYQHIHQNKGLAEK